MPFMLARRGRCIVRQFGLRETLPLSTRVSLVPRHVRRVSLAVNDLSLKQATPTGPVRSVLSQIQATSYATAGRPKAHTGRAKASTGSSGSKKTGKKSTSSKKKELTPEEKEAKKEAQKAKALKEEIKQLKITALEPPKKLPQSAYTVAFQEKMVSGPKEEGKPPAQHFKEVANAVKELPSYELERYAQIAESNKAENSAAYDAWIKSHTPLQIKDANAARRRLKQLLGDAKSGKYYQLSDDRLVKKAASPYALFLKERYESGDFKHMSVQEAAARAGEEWKGLTESEKQKFNELYKEAYERYSREHREIYGEDPPSHNKKSRGSEESS
ncbi:transcriptional regulator family: HMG [Paecilomyces variotii]|nr:transcriptional regulator family: HMG [Paecilomyces variotii]KAJ9279170.1 transcriptional regulator family: HMG [Paecilomyces variotii]KAJ9340285.1 transcriptional regulator family: HMG [Paecilomyces variotii]KAJ9385210.1 transcriptional regulator family: HMG [Paecilomyces variotii]KAJ9404802.1 transcriptional regulator family: HMG [Paecilomyces variotii]